MIKSYKQKLPNRVNIGEQSMTNPSTVNVKNDIGKDLKNNKKGVAEEWWE